MLTFSSTSLIDSSARPSNTQMWHLIISIITTVLILFSCSWSIWQTDVVLTYIMFLASLYSLITSGKHKGKSFNAIE